MRHQLLLIIVKINNFSVFLWWWSLHLVCLVWFLGSLNHRNLNRHLDGLNLLLLAVSAVKLNRIKLLILLQTLLLNPLNTLDQFKYLMMARGDLGTTLFDDGVGSAISEQINMLLQRSNPAIQIRVFTVQLLDFLKGLEQVFLPIRYRLLIFGRSPLNIFQAVVDVLYHICNFIKVWNGR